MRTTLLTVLSLMLSLSPVAWGRGIFVTPGTKANTLGAAFVAIADDASAIYWNPAGLSQLKGRGFEMSAVYAAATVTGNQSVNNVAVPDQDDGDFPLMKVYDAVASGGLLPTAEPARYDNKEFELTAAIPFFAGYASYKDTVFAIGYYGSAGGGGTWKDTVGDIIGFGDSITSKIDAQYFMMVYNLSAGRRINDRWSVGVGLDLVSMHDEAKVSKNYEASAASLLGSYSLINEKEANGTGFQGNVGLIFAPADKWRTGLVYRTGTTIGLSGTETLDVTGLPVAGYARNYDQDYTYPETYSLGAAYDASEKWTLAVAAMQNSYSRSRLKIEYENGASQDVSLRYKDTTQLCAGAEYRHNETWTFRGGAYNDPVQVPTEKLTLFNSNEFNVIYYIVGTEYKKGPLALNVALGYGTSDNPSKGDRNYTYTSNIVRFQAQYAF